MLHLLPGLWLEVLLGSWNTWSSSSKQNIIIDTILSCCNFMLLRNHSMNLRYQDLGARENKMSGKKLPSAWVPVASAWAQYSPALSVCPSGSSRSSRDWVYRILRLPVFFWHVPNNSFYDFTSSHHADSISPLNQLNKCMFSFHRGWHVTTVLCTTTASCVSATDASIQVF